MRGIALLLSALALGCGRFGYDSLSDDDALVEGGSVDGGAPVAEPVPEPEPWPSGPFSSPIPLSSLNTGAFEDDPSATADLLEIYFERSGGPTAIGDIWRANRSSRDETWGPPAKVSELNTADDEGAPRVAADGLTIWFSSSRPGLGSFDVYRSRRAFRSARWDPPELVTTVNGSGAETLFVVDAAGTNAVFARLSTGLALNSLDLFATSRPSPSSPWSEPAAVTELNTTHGEASGSLSPNGLILYFYSNVDGGPVNLYRAERTGLLEPFGAPTPVDELNTASRDEDPWVSPDGHTLFFTRDGDLYETWRPR